MFFRELNNIRKMKVELLFKWYDFWIGAFYDKKKNWLYILPLPMLGFILKFPEKWRMSHVLRCLKRAWFKLDYHESRSDNRLNGKFKVLYGDGRESENMCWKAAVDYAKIFNGEVKDSF